MSSFLDKIIEDPSAVFSSKSVNSKEALNLVKQFLDPIASSSSVLDEIYTDGLDSSQVWGQVKLVVDGVNDKLLIDQIPTLKEKFGVTVGDEHSAEEEEEISQDEQNSEEEEDEQASEDEEEEGSEDEEEEFHSLDEEEEEEEEEEVSEPVSSKPIKPKKDAFGLNDGFFDIDEFNKQVLAQEEDNNDLGDDEEIDYFNDVSDSDDDDIAYHDDFFRQQQASNNKQKKDNKVTFEDEDEIFGEDGQFVEQEYDKAVGSTMLDLFADDDDEEEMEEDLHENLSTFEKQQREIQKEIAKLEQEAVAEKKWSLKGESKAKDRPSDSLLNEDLEFERTAKPVPVITKEVTESIEELIRRRIKDQQFDELEKKLISDVAKFNNSRRFELSEEKSSKSLAEQYEDDYKGTTDSSLANEELIKAHQEISQLFQSLTHKLDSLCSAHFIPKPAQKALDVKVDTDTISMEDAQPLTFSSSSTLAPQELFNVKTGINNKEVSLKSGLVISKDELSRDDKQRLRRLNKRKKSKDFKNKPAVKKSKKNDVIDTLSKAKNLTVINNKGEKRDVKGNLVKEKQVGGSSSLKL